MGGSPVGRRPSIRAALGRATGQVGGGKDDGSLLADEGAQTPPTRFQWLGFLTRSVGGGGGDRFRTKVSRPMPITR